VQIGVAWQRGEDGDERVQEQEKAKDKSKSEIKQKIKLGEIS